MPCQRMLALPRSHFPTAKQDLARALHVHWHQLHPPGCCFSAADSKRLMANTP